MVGILEKIALVQCYIHHKKNIEVNINPPSNINDVFLLEKAYSVAQNYFSNGKH